MMCCAWRLPRAISVLSVSLLFLGATAASAEDCRSIDVIGNAREVVDCPAGHEDDFCIVRTSLVDRSGLLTGRLEYIDYAAKGSKHPQDPSMQLYVGLSKITTDKGTLDIDEYGIFDSDSLEYAGLGKIAGGTGELAGFAGTVTSSGHAKGSSQIAGTICKE